jgi:hypothetical protein
VRFEFAPKFASFSGIYRSVIGISQNFGQRSKNKIASVEIDDLGVFLVILLQTEAPMGKGLSVQPKRKLCEYRSELENDGRNFSYKDHLAYCEENLNLGPSSTAICKIWQDREKWATVKDSNKLQRVRGAKWPELEKALVLWITQVQSCFHYFRSCLLLVC